MVCAQSNMAVDWISEKLVDQGVPVLRIGNPTRVVIRCYPLPTNDAESHPDYPQLWSIRRYTRNSTAVRARSGTGKYTSEN